MPLWRLLDISPRVWFVLKLRLQNMILWGEEVFASDNEMEKWNPLERVAGKRPSALHAAFSRPHLILCHKLW